MSLRSSRLALGGIGLLVVVGLSVQGQLPPSPPGFPEADPPVPTVVVRLRAPAETAPGTEAIYRITAENTSRSAAHHVLLKVAVPSKAKVVRATPTPESEAPQLAWKFGTLEPGQKREVTVVLLPTTEDDIDVCARVQFEHGQCVRTQIRKPGLNLRRTGPTSTLFGEPVTYQLLISNTGKITAKNLVVEETLPDGLDFSDSKPPTKGDNPLLWNLGDLSPGQSRTIQYDVFVKKEGKLPLRTLVRGDGLKLERTATLEVGNPQLDITLTGPDSRPVGRICRYNIVVHNRGSAALSGVKLSDELPREIVFKGANGGRLDANTVRWDLGTIPAGSKRMVWLEVQSTQPGEYKHIVDAFADRGLREQAKVVTQFRNTESLSVEIDPDPEPVTVGQETTLSIRLENLGKRPENKVQLTIQIPPEMDLIEARGPGAHQAMAGAVRFPPVDSLQPGDALTAILRLKPTKPGKRIIQAQAGTSKTEQTLDIQPAPKQKQANP
jgi:uncharacterized repeat protein (TIGR01451 family)